MFDFLRSRKGLYTTLFMFSRTPQDLCAETLICKIGGVTHLGCNVFGAV